MTFTIKSTKTPSKSATLCVIPVGDDLKVKANKFIKDALAASTIFKGKLGQTLSITLPEKEDFTHAVLLGIGKAKDLDALKSEESGGKLFTALKGAGVKSVALLGETLKPEQLAHIGAGAHLASYVYEKHKTPPKKKGAPKFTTLELISGDAANVKKLYTSLSHTIAGTFLARDLVNDPPNHLYPESYAKIIKDELTPLGVKVEVLDEKKMLKMGMGGIMGVGQGSIRQPRMVIMRWMGAPKSKDTPIALVGKGVTFDTGGISLKPGAGMEDMKMDMGGSAAVVGTMKALALRGAKSNVIGAVGLAENMPSSNAYRPGDVLKSYSGKTIEIHNTDAEGRLVLADTLTYVQEQFKPKTVIDLATLTGAMMVALGHEYCGVYANDDTLWSGMDKASGATGEKLWRMPLDKVFKDSMKGTFGDVQNMSKLGRWAGANTAAGFLEHFIEDGVNWAHMDIAGTAWIKTPKPTVPKYGTGFGVRVLNQLIADTYE